MHPDVLTIRADIESDIEGLTLTRVFADTAANQGDAPAYSDKVGVPSDATGDAAWRTLTWQQVAEQARHVGAAFVEAGVRPGDRVAVMVGNRIEHVLADLGALHAGAVPMSIYGTLSTEQVTYVAGHSEPTVVILETEEHLRRWGAALGQVPSIHTVIVLDAGVTGGGHSIRSWDDLIATGAAHGTAHPGALDERMAAITPGSPATIIYTSGTTGNPKGVVLSHRNVLVEVLGLQRQSGFREPNVSISYLPLAHVAERGLTLYVPWSEGGHVHLIGDPALLLGTLAEVRPTRFFGVPRVWEKIKTGVAARLAAEQDPQIRAFVEQSMATGLEWVESQQVGQVTSPDLQRRYEQADAAMLSVLRSLLGLDRVEWAACAAAPMPLEVTRFFAGLGLRVFDMYGMTETSGVVTAGGPDHFRMGTVGRALPGIEVAVATDGEILARGPVATDGYFRSPEASAELIDADGWVRTGDIGEIDADGFVKIVDRKKELIITSSGKNIAPTNIENHLKSSPVIAHAMTVGDARSYLVALLTLDGEIAPLLAAQLGIEFTDLADLAENPAIRALAQQSVDDANERLSRPEQVKAFELLGNEWTAESEELTPTLKLKRRVITAKYADVIDRLYA